jgi:glycosyltransferase involved in cell wall biosynthesis
VAEPLVSAIVLSYDAGRYLGAAIESVRAQTHPRMELVLVDNGSTDDSREVADCYSPDIKVWIDPNRGICPARNAGLAVARGDYIGFLDGDDLWELRKTEVQLAAFAADPSPDLVLGRATQFATPELDEEAAARIRVPEGSQPGRILGAMLAPRETWERVGPWRRELILGDGLDWFLRASALGLRDEMVEETVLRRRLHGRNAGIQLAEAQVELARVLKERLDQRRREEA